jgi:hypothetical protein
VLEFFGHFCESFEVCFVGLEDGGFFFCYG